MYLILGDLETSKMRLAGLLSYVGTGLSLGRSQTQKLEDMGSSDL